MKKVAKFILLIILIAFALKGFDVFLVRLSSNNETLCRLTEGHWVDLEEARKNADEQEKARKEAGTVLVPGKFTFTSTGCVEYMGGDYPHWRNQSGGVLWLVLTSKIMRIRTILTSF